MSLADDIVVYFEDTKETIKNLKTQSKVQLRARYQIKHSQINSFLNSNK